MKRIIATLSLILFVSFSFAQNIEGDWYGLLKVPGPSLTVVLHLKKGDTGYTGTMDSPDQNAMGMPMDKVEFSNPRLVISAVRMGMRYEGVYNADSNKISGVFHQGGLQFPLSLSKNRSLIKAANQPRPQDPKDFPYRQEEVMFTNPKGGHQLAGTLTLPTNGKAKKIVVLITGSGPQNRNEEVAAFNHRPFLVLSDWLTRNGIAVLRYDDRGTAKSTGNFLEATTADFADDVEAAVNYIGSRPDLKKLSLGLVGHSEGGIIAPIIAGRNKQVKFIVLLAGTGVPSVELLRQQNEDLMRASGLPDSTIALNSYIQRIITTTIAGYPDLALPALKQKISSSLNQGLEPYLKNNDRTTIDGMIAVAAERSLTKWTRYFIQFNPAVYLSKVKCPVLALNGTLDIQVKAEPNLAGIKSALEKAGNKNFEIVAMPNLNHLFQKAVTGNVNEYSELTETINPEVLNKVSNWINTL